MKIGILGTGDVGRALGHAFLALGHEVRMGARSATNEKATAWVAAEGAQASHGTFAEAARFGDILVLATLGSALPEVIAAAGLDGFQGKVVIDPSNPLDFSAGFPPRLSVSGEDSLGERVQAALPEARVVKAFNTVGHAHMFRPAFAVRPTMFLAGDDEAAKALVGGICEDFGWSSADAGDIRSSRYLEAMCLVWVITAAKRGSYDQAFALVTP